MITVGLLLMVVGFFLIAVGSGEIFRSARSVSIGRQWWSVPQEPDRGYDSMPPRRNRLIRVLVGLVMIGGGLVIIAMSS